MNGTGSLMERHWLIAENVASLWKLQVIWLFTIYKYWSSVFKWFSMFASHLHSNAPTKLISCLNFIVGGNSKVILCFSLSQSFDKHFMINKYANDGPTVSQLENLWPTISHLLIQLRVCVCSCEFEN